MPRPGAGTITPAEKLLRQMVSQGIRSGEGMQVFRRVLQDFACNRVVVSSVDLDALLEQNAEPITSTRGEDATFERPQLANEYLEPSTEAQRQLAELWQDLLGIGSVGIRDSFFDLGGHSLIAVRLFAKIKKLWGISLPVAVLLELPTIEELAKQLPSRSDAGQTHSSATSGELESSDLEARGWTSLVPIRKEGSRPPFYCVAGKGGNPLNLRHLAKRLDPSQPFYGIQHRGVDGVLPVHDSIEGMASECIRDLRVVQASGPYLLGGFSGGGLVAFEMAKQLKAAGEQIALLALFDTPSPTRLFMSKRDRLALHFKQLRQQGPKYLVEKLAGRISRLFPRRSPNESPTDAEPENGLPPHVAVGLAWDRMELRYSQCPWQGSAVLFRPYLTNPEDVDVFLNEDRFNGWHEFLLGGIEVVELPGGHNTMFEEPHVRILAKRLTAILSAAQKEASPCPPSLS